MNEVERMYENCNFEKSMGVDSPLALYPFTAEKQLRLLQLLTQQCDLIISHFTKWEFIYFDGQESTQVTGKDYAETLAKLINSLWQDLDKEEKQQIKKMLE